MILENLVVSSDRFTSESDSSILYQKMSKYICLHNIFSCLYYKVNMLNSFVFVSNFCLFVSISVSMFHSLASCLLISCALIFFLPSSSISSRRHALQNISNTGMILCCLTHQRNRLRLELIDSLSTSEILLMSFQGKNSSVENITVSTIGDSDF